MGCRWFEYLILINAHFDTYYVLTFPFSCDIKTEGSLKHLYIIKIASKKGLYEREKKFFYNCIFTNAFGAVNCYQYFKRPFLSLRINWNVRPVMPWSNPFFERNGKKYFCNKFRWIFFHN